MIAGPEVARLINEFEVSSESSHSKQVKGPDLLHHEQVSYIQKAFAKQVTSLVDVFLEFGNPFGEETGDLLVLDTRDVMNEDVTNTVRNIKQIGQDGFHKLLW